MFHKMKIIFLIQPFDFSGKKSNAHWHLVYYMLWRGGLKISITYHNQLILNQFLLTHCYLATGIYEMICIANHLIPVP